jgi:hypothetical protein
MGWCDLIRRRSVRTKTSAVSVAASLAEAIIQSTNLLRTRLAAEGFGWTDPTRAAADECLLECTLFEWFLRDLVVLDGFGSRAGTVRQALGGRLLIDLQRSGLSVACLAGFDGRCTERFAEYGAALQLSSSLQPLGALAWRRISGKDEPSERMTMLLANRANAELKGLRDVAAKYAIVEHARSPLPLVDRP